MFELSFLFAGALWLLPLAGLPVALHLLYRRKSPVVMFGTLRFVRASLQRTAARRRVQKWVLLAARVLLLALLIWAVAQPARKLASTWIAPGGSQIAVIVLDTSYSMQAQSDQVTLLARADSAAQELMRGELADSRVAIFRSNSDPADATLTAASSRLAQWTPSDPTPSPAPLADRVAAARAFLDRQDAQQKWLIVLSDFRAREFPRPLPEWKGGKTAAIDLAPDTLRSAGIVGLTLTPDPPLAGVGCEAVVTVQGRAGDARAVTITVADAAGKILQTIAPRVARLEAAGVTEIRVPLRLPAEPWQVIRASLDGDDDLPWDDARQLALELPPKRPVHLLGDAATSPGERSIRLALDWSEGKLVEWPLRVTSGAAVNADDQVVVTSLLAWPSEADALRLKRVTDRGGTVVLFLRPGLQEAWAGLPEGTRQVLSGLLPGTPITDPAADRPARALAGAGTDRTFADLFDPRFQIDAITTARYVPFRPAGDAVALVRVAPATPAAGSAPAGLIYRRAAGAGTVYTFATLPDAPASNLSTHPIFLPLLVRACLPAAGQSHARNIDLGGPLELAGHTAAATINTPAGDPFVVPAPAAGTPLRFDRATAPGLYVWHAQDGTEGTEVIGLGTVQPAAGESDPAHAAPAVVLPGERVFYARSLEDVRTAAKELAEPEPRWSGAIALVLLLLCVEALFGNNSRLWSAATWRRATPIASAA